MRGDRPRPRSLSRLSTSFTPHARGSTRARSLPMRFQPVYPACAGIDLCVKLTGALTTSLPRMRGDRPWFRFRTYLIVKFTPHARGSTHNIHTYTTPLPVYPACAGIDLGQTRKRPPAESLPRMRGDRPYNGVENMLKWEFTPHARGSTLPPLLFYDHDAVYPACAGIDPIFAVVSDGTTSLPRMRGDRPTGVT